MNILENIMPQKKSDNKELVPTLEQIKRLQALQGVDSGLFTLAVFSTIEAYFRDKLGNLVDNSTKFYELVDLYLEEYSKSQYKEKKLLSEIKYNQKNTNKVRHEFKNLSLEEAYSATHLLASFASLFNLPNLAQINSLTTTLNLWDARKSPAETARELERVNQELKRLSQTNTDMLQKVEAYEAKKKELELISAKMKNLELEYEQQIEKNKQNKDRIDELVARKILLNRKIAKQKKNFRNNL